LDALRVEPPEAWQLCGVSAGAESGVDCLDVDLDGRGWYEANFDAVPLTRAHETQRGGVHLLFKHAPGLRKSESRIAPGVDVRADASYFIWWPREGLPFEDHPICEWPDWLLAEAMEPRSLRGSSSQGSSFGGGVPTVPIQSLNPSELEAALVKLDPRDFGKGRMGKEAFAEWRRLMFSAKVAGVDREAFIEWSTSDPAYADAEDVIRRMWDRYRPDGRVSAGTLRRALQAVEGAPLVPSQKSHRSHL
jgi:hypothetical protein